MSPTDSGEGASTSKRTVLVVDPDPQTGIMLSSILTPLGWAMEIAPDNKTVLELVRNRPYELIITGEETAAREDIELLQEIRRVRPHERLIILTGDGTPQDVVTSMREHAFAYFSKPFSMESLAEAVRMVTDGPCWDDGIEVLMATPSWIRLAVRCDVKTADRLLIFLAEIADLPPREKCEVGIAFREMLLNAIEHGGRLDPEQYVEISYVRGDRAVGCRIKDPGEGFSLEEIRHAAVANPPEDPMRHVAHRDEMGLRPGGYGVLMARHLVDELIYGEKGNEVLLVKYLPKERGQPFSTGPLPEV
jgi:anti-sigma regulatory factor (Ser/Thr protein kinase)/ActR/RegA family two-component response regulator